MLFVLIAVALLGTIPIAIATVTTNQLPQTTRNLNFEAAYEAAQGGLNDYLQHLDANESYGLYCKTCSNGTAGNPAFTSWVPPPPPPWRTYSYAPTDKSGLISLEVSGKAGTGATAWSGPSTSASSRPEPERRLLDQLRDPHSRTSCPVPRRTPVLPTHSTSRRRTVPELEHPRHPPVRSADSGCEVSFQTGDVLNGPVFSDDTFRLCGTPSFTSSVESGNIYNTTPAARGIYVGSSGCGSDTPSFTGPTADQGQQPDPADGF